jgi:acyl carrier protein
VVERAELAVSLAQLMSKVLDEEVDPTALNATLVQDYGADSMDIVDIAERIEAEYKVTIKNKDIPQFIHFGDILDFISRAAEVKSR